MKQPDVQAYGREPPGVVLLVERQLTAAIRLVGGGPRRRARTPTQVRDHGVGDAFDASFTGFDDWMPVDGIGLSRDESVLRAGVSLWPARSFGVRLGLTREQGFSQGQRKLVFYAFDLLTYNHVRTWNNPDNWANPENWGKYWW